MSSSTLHLKIFVIARLNFSLLVWVISYHHTMIWTLHALGNRWCWAFFWVLIGSVLLAFTLKSHTKSLVLFCIIISLKDFGFFPYNYCTFIHSYCWYKIIDFIMCIICIMNKIYINYVCNEYIYIHIWTYIMNVNMSNETHYIYICICVQIYI